MAYTEVHFDENDICVGTRIPRLYREDDVHGNVDTAMNHVRMMDLPSGNVWIGVDYAYLKEVEHELREAHRD